MEEWLGFLALSALALLAGGALARQEQDARLRAVLLGGLVLRLVGATVRYEVLMLAYDGVGDATGYFAFGQQYAERIASFDFSFIWTTYQDTHWWGTDFIRSVSGFVVFLVGRSMPGAFLAFSLLGFIGIVLLVRSFQVAVGVKPAIYAAMVCFLPSLWFWPSSIGKESVMMLATGLTVRGYVGDGTRSRWPTLIFGVALASAIRPHVAAVMAGCVALAELMRVRGDGRSRWLVGFLALVLCAVAINIGLNGLGLQDADLEGIEEEVMYRAVQTEKGGSQISRTSGWALAPMAFVNVLFRPFPGEGGVLGFFSGLEVWVVWAVIFSRRAALATALRGWRKSALLCIAPPFASAMTVLYGVAFANLGIIARQRVVILPFLLILPALAMAPSLAAKVSPSALPRVRMKAVQ